MGRGTRTGVRRGAKTASTRLSALVSPCVVAVGGVETRDRVCGRRSSPSVHRRPCPSDGDWPCWLRKEERLDVPRSPPIWSVGRRQAQRGRGAEWAGWSGGERAADVPGLRLAASRPRRLAYHGRACRAVPQQAVRADLDTQPTPPPTTHYPPPRRRQWDGRAHHGYNSPPPPRRSSRASGLMIPSAPTMDGTGAHTHTAGVVQSKEEATTGRIAHTLTACCRCRTVSTPVDARHVASIPY